MTPAEFGIVGDALAVAELAIAEHPWTRITSGKRDRAQHAAALAQNELAAPGFIAATYAESKPKRSLLATLAVLKKSPKLTVALLTAGFLQTLNGFDDVALLALSSHYDGTAVDFLPELRALKKGERGVVFGGWEVVTVIDGVRYTITDRCLKLATSLEQQAKARGGKFLIREGGLVRLHWQAKRGA